MNIYLCRAAWVAASLLPLAGQAQAPVYQLDLTEQILSLPEARFHVAQVLDLRVNRNTIGWVQRGLYNVPVPADMRGGAAAGLTQWLQTQLPAKPGSRPVIMRIHELRIGELTKVTSEKARAVVDIDFVVQQPDSSYYIVMRHSDEEIHGGIETTGFHDDNIAACLRRGLALLSTQPWEPRLSGAQPLTAQQIRYRDGRVPEPYTYPVMVAAAPKRGFYSDFLAFRRNAPDTSQVFEVEKTPRTATDWQGTEEIRVFLGTGPTRTAFTEGWGFSDGKQSYIQFRKHYYPLRQVGNDFVFEGRAGADPGAVGTASAVAGLAGGAIAAVATTGRRQSYTLDMATGRVADFTYQEQLLRRDTAAVVIFRRPGGAKEPLRVLLEGKELGQLGPNAMLELPWASKTREVTVCLEKTGICYSFIPDFTTVNYVELQAKTDAEPPALQLVPSKEGIFYTKKMRSK